MKKLLIATMTILALIGLCSCGSDDSTTQSGSTFTLKGSGT